MIKIFEFHQFNFKPTKQTPRACVSSQEKPILIFSMFAFYKYITQTNTEGYNNLIN